jgi:hypothetical protein
VEGVALDDSETKFRRTVVSVLNLVTAHSASFVAPYVCIEAQEDRSWSFGTERGSWYGDLRDSHYKLCAGVNLKINSGARDVLGMVAAIERALDPDKPLPVESQNWNLSPGDLEPMCARVQASGFVPPQRCIFLKQDPRGLEYGHFEARVGEDGVRVMHSQQGWTADFRTIEAFELWAKANS